MKVTAEDLGEPGWDSEFGWGRVDFGKAAELAVASAAEESLKIEAQDAQSGQLLISAEFYPGLNYQFMQTTNLNAAVWTPVSALMQTNTMRVGFWLVPDKDQSFYKVSAQFDF